MKRWIALMLAAAMLCSLAGCVTEGVPSGSIAVPPEKTEPTGAQPTIPTGPSLPPTEPSTGDPTEPAHTHEYQQTVADPTCMEKGYTTYSCTCGNSYTGKETAALGHNWSSWETTLEPTATDEGEAKRSCGTCGSQETKKLAVLGHIHSYTSSVTAPTCLEKGYTTYTCHCGDSYIDQEVSALGHNYTEVTAREPSCTAEGENTYTCACGYSYKESIPRLPHSYTASVTEPTCTAEGVKIYTCACGDTYRETLAKLPHSYTASVTAPTCTEQGYTSYTCACGESYRDAYTAPAGHAWGPWQTTLEPTEDAEGEAKRSCSTCGAEETKRLATLSHAHHYTPTVTAPTCVQRGYTTYTCSCGDSYVDDYTPTVDHSWDDGTVIQEAANTWYEQRRYTCRNCPATEVHLLVDGKPYAPQPGNSRYGYEDFGTHQQGLALQTLYLRLYEACETFRTSAADVQASNGSYALEPIRWGDLGITADQMSSVWYVFRQENPLYYWLSNRYAWGGDRLLLYIEPEYAQASARKSADSAISAMAAQCAAQLSSSMTELQRAQVIYDYVRWRMDYAYEADGITPQDDAWAHSMVGGAVYKQGVCESYSKIYMYLCLLSDVTCIYVTGDAGGPHAWNYICIDGSWYGVDCTWDDSGHGYAYFGSSATTLGKDHIPDLPGAYGVDYWYALPILSSEDIRITSIIVPSCVDRIADYAFYGCKDLVSITLPAGITVIGRAAFYECSSLRSIYIPGSVTSIGDYAFTHCTSLTDIQFGGTTAQWNAITKGDYWDNNTGKFTVTCTDGKVKK